jgi:hypothetical protein
VVNGGRARVAGLAELLAELGPTTVLVARNAHRTVEVVAPAVALPAARRSRLTALVSPGPRLGRGLLDRGSRSMLRGAVDGSPLLVVSHSYLVPEVGRDTPPLVVDFPNLEVERQRSMGGWLGRVESVKARSWEPAVARRACLCIAVDEHDADRLLAWGARRVVVVPNAAPGLPVSPPSPVAGSVLAVADWTYEPNRAGLEQLRASGLPLVVAGRGSEAWPEGRGFVDDLSPLYDEAAVVIAPATTGAGTQLKVVEAVCRGRVVVTTPYGARSLPAAARDVCVVGDLATSARRLLDDVEDRHRREAVLRAAALPRTWQEAGAPLLSALRSLWGEEVFA